MAIHQTQKLKPSSIPHRFPATPLDQYIYLSYLAHDRQHRSVTMFSEQVDAGRMAQAIRLSLDAEPVLGCRFVENPWKPYWERRDDLDSIPLCPVVESRDIESELSEFMAAPMDPYEDPQIQARIFRSDSDTLCIKMNHTVADAVGLIDFMDLLSKNYRELSHDPTYRPSPNLRKRCRHSQFLMRVSPLSIIRSFCHFSYPRSPWSFPITGQDLSSQSFKMRRIKPDRFANIRAYCQQHQVTMNVILLTAFYRALFEVLAPPVDAPLPVAGTFNLRRYLKPSEAKTICNLAGSFFTIVNMQSGDTFSDTLAQVRKATEVVNTNKTWLSEAVCLNFAFLFGFCLARHILQQYFRRGTQEAALGKAIPYLANIGIINPEQIDFGDAKVSDYYTLSPVPYPPGFILSASTFCNNMHFAIGFYDKAMDSSIIERFLDLFICELPE